MEARKFSMVTTWSDKYDSTQVQFFESSKSPTKSKPFISDFGATVLRDPIAAS